MHAIKKAICAVMLMAGQGLAFAQPAGGTDAGGNQSIAPAGAGSGLRNEAATSSGAAGSVNGATGAAGQATTPGAPAVDCPPVERELPGAARERSGDPSCGPSRASGAADPARRQNQAPPPRP